MGQGIRVLAAYSDPTFGEKSASVLNQLTWPPLSTGWAISVVEPMFVTDLPDWVKIKRDPDVEAMAAAWAEDHRQSLQAAVVDLEKFRSHLPPCFSRERMIVDEGRPADAILRHIRENAIELVAMGSRSTSGLMTFFLGSTSDEVLREAPCSVLIVR